MQRLKSSLKSTPTADCFGKEHRNFDVGGLGFPCFRAVGGRPEYDRYAAWAGSRSDGAAVAGSPVTVTNEATQVSQTTTTSSGGNL